MCYYNGMKVTRSEYIRLVSLEKSIKHLAEAFNTPMYNGFAYADYPVVMPVDGGRDIDVRMAHWEFVPPWVNDMTELIASRKKYSTLNAIGEELFEKRLYKDAALKRRCLIPSSGFYEWRDYKAEGEKKAIKYPYYITVKNREYSYIAGIWQPWTDKETGETIDTFALVTTKANSLMEQVHNTKKRQPTILTEDLALEWIQDGLPQSRISEIATFQLPASEMEAYTIYKDFRGLEDPTTPYQYGELPALVM